ncbi:N-acetylglucosamine kinase [Streptomyces purpurogeneiscleroticus]|uniref:N-acetylglucosamine kinase n=1 Tax=Streptomyces purpurogeneiscleroticus TaxID=68259 RepID=UPI001CBB844D|nr:BadF/BadG/BcrA/BcrD ATPase family protein [Streptomyces purpurogeneiscleroticus]
MGETTPAPGPELVLGVDSGGSGLRIAVARAHGNACGTADGNEAAAAGAPAPARRLRTVVFREPVRTGPDGIDPDDLLGRLLPTAGSLLREAGGDGRCAAVCVGAAGMGTLGDGLRAALPAALSHALGTDRLALAADAVTAYAGALGQHPGAVVAAGTGMVALGTDLTPATGWRRADGWGHLLGDCGSGAWIGRAGLEAAMRAHDGRPGGSAALLARAEAVFGPVTGLPGKLYPRADRPAVLASFAPEVARCAAEDKFAAAILDEAAHHIADAAAAVCPPAATPTGRAVAYTGGLFKMGEPLLEPLRAALAVRLPGVRLRAADGDPLDGALLIASAVARDALRLPTDDRLLHVAR